MLVRTSGSSRPLRRIKDSRLRFPGGEFLLLTAELQPLVPGLLDRLALHLVKAVFSGLVVERLAGQIGVCLLRVHFDHRLSFDSLPFRIIL